MIDDAGWGWVDLFQVLAAPWSSRWAEEMGLRFEVSPALRDFARSVLEDVAGTDAGAEFGSRLFDETARRFGDQIAAELERAASQMGVEDDARTAALTWSIGLHWITSNKGRADRDVGELADRVRAVARDQAITAAAVEFVEACRNYPGTHGQQSEAALSLAEEALRVQSARTNVGHLRRALSEAEMEHLASWIEEHAAAAGIPVSRESLRSL